MLGTKCLVLVVNVLKVLGFLDIGKDSDADMISSKFCGVRSESRGSQR